MMINKAYKMMDNIEDIVDNQQQKLPNEEELKVKLSQTSIKTTCFNTGKGEAKGRGKHMDYTNMSILQFECSSDIGFVFLCHQNPCESIR